MASRSLPTAVPCCRRVCAAPSQGEANAALGRLIAKAVGVPPSRVAIVGGAASRIKRVRIVGDGATLAATLGKIAGTV
jgi:uncharacterized protein